jgi:signal transduction histidine kinase/ligand-binding sensor domain-containing protein
MIAIRPWSRIVCLAACVGVWCSGGQAIEPQQGISQYSFAQWGHRDGLPSATIYTLAQTPDGFLWLGTSDGLVRFDGLQFVQVPLSKGGDTAFGRVRALMVDDAGSLWIGTESGSLVQMRGGEKRVVPVGAAVNSIRQTQAGTRQTVEVETTVGALCFDPETMAERAVPPKTQLPASTSTLASNASLLRRAGLLESQVRKAVRDSEGTVWIATRESGVVRIPHAVNPTEINRITKANGLSNDSVWDVVEDRERNIWIATQNGLNRLRKGRFTTLTRGDGLLSDTVTSLVADRGTIYAGSNLGWNRVTVNHAVVAGRDTVVALASTSDGGLLIATTHGIERWDGTHTEALPLGFEPKHVTAVAEDALGEVWFYDADKGLFRWHKGDAAIAVTLPGQAREAVTVITTDALGNNWFGLSSGDVLLRRGEDVRRFTMADGLAGGVPHSISPLPDGGAWIASERGLSLYDNDEVSAWSRRNGLPGNRVLWAVPGPDDRLWLGYNVGVASVRVRDLQQATKDAGFQVPYDFFDEADGLKSGPDLRSDAPALVSPEGRLWLTTAEGLATLDLRHIPRDIVPPPVHILALRADDVDRDMTSGVKLPSKTHRVEINYTGVSLADASRITFRYRLLAFDPRWHEVSGRRFATYTNLPPGRYHFEVMAANEDGVWSAAPATMEFEIAPAIYQRTWFLVLCGAALLLATVVVVRLRVRAAAKGLRSRFEERLEERARVAQDLHDNLLQDVMGISLQLEIADELTPEESAGKPVLQRALALCASTLAGGRGVLTMLRTTMLSREELLRAVAVAAEPFPEARRRAVHLSADGEELPVRATVGEEMIQIAREALRNALQHTQGEVRLSLHSMPGRLRLVVEDEGDGIAPEIQDDGIAGHFGLRGMRERAARIGATLSFRSRTEHGTRVELDVPADMVFAHTESMQRRWTRFVKRRKEATKHG